ncbi:MAG: hypothetical protein IT328_23675 [Caldilineaceae bacterium]|nr:hypothetical protein [Caldilineaceae bacterium]
MADLPNPNDNDDVALDRTGVPSTPRWVYFFGIIALVVIVLFVILHLTGGGFRGHGGHTPPSSVIEQSVQQP